MPRKIIAHLDRESCLEHNSHVPNEIADSVLDTPERVLVLVSKIYELVPVVSSERKASDIEILRCISDKYWKFLNSVESSCMDADKTTYFSKESIKWAKRSAGCVIDAALAAFSSSNDTFAICRPPGHHNACSTRLEVEWENDIAQPGNFIFACHGGCILPNIPIAIRALKHKYGEALRVAVVDIDAHFGDGTALHFDDDESVLTISLHCDQSFKTQNARYFPFYEGIQGETKEDGSLPLGMINIPLPDKANDTEAIRALKTALPALKAHLPDIIFIACGFDGLKADSSSSLNYTDEGYRLMVSLLLNTIDNSDRNNTEEKNILVPVVCVLEGGYNPDGVAASFKSIVNAFTDCRGQTNKK